MERFRECFYRPMLSSTASFERWLKLGGKDATARATETYQKRLDEYEPPPMDEAVRAELEEFVTRRHAELGGQAMPGASGQPLAPRGSRSASACRSCHAGVTAPT